MFPKKMNFDTPSFKFISYYQLVELFVPLCFRLTIRYILAAYAYGFCLLLTTLQEASFYSVKSCLSKKQKAIFCRMKEHHLKQ